MHRPVQLSLTIFAEVRQPCCIAEGCQTSFRASDFVQSGDHAGETMKRVTEISWQLQQRVNIFFCVKIRWTFDKIKAALHTCYPRILCDTSIHNWIRQFRAGRQNITDKPRAAKNKSGRSPRNIRCIESLVAQDRRVMIQGMAAKTGLAPTTIQRILKKDLKLTKRCSTFVPAMLTDAHKQRRKDVCNFFTRLRVQRL